MGSSGDHARLRHALSPLRTTALDPFAVTAQQHQQQLNTPMSAISMASSSIYSPQSTGSALQPYNPQEWMPPLNIAGAERPQQPAGDGQSNPPPPPPPYSPPRNRQPRPLSLVFDHGSASTSTPPQRAGPSNLHRPSPEQHSSPSFAPPPGGRGSSRERRFGIPALSWRRDHEQPSTSSTSHQTPPSLRQSMGPMAFQLLEQDGRSPMPTSAIEAGPPAARRAASTGAIDTPTSARSRSASQTRWEPGMPLPPPPPGPPPSSRSGTRSQSVQPLDMATVPIIAVPVARRPPSSGSALGPVPPTPASWLDSDHPPDQAERGRSPAFTTDTTSTAERSGQATDPAASSSTASGLNRAKAVRHDKTIIQRRSESRSGHDSRGSVDETGRSGRVSDIFIPPISNDLSQRLAGSKTTPRSAGKSLMDTVRTGESSGRQDSRESTPRAIGSAKLGQMETSTPPFSPQAKAGPSQSGTSQKSSIIPKALPTPPSQTRSASSSGPREASRPPSALPTPVSRHLLLTQTTEQFAASAIERFQAFAAKEASAATDADRVRLFADFIVSESRIRRERYASAIGMMGSEIFDWTRDLFKPLSAATRESGPSDGWTPESSEPTRSQRGSFGSSYRGEFMTNSDPSSANLPMSPTGAPQNSINWTSNYMPSLSPILSMSVSDRQDGSSRGRPSSRWWESDSQGDASRGLDRSKRESKYMGVPKDQWSRGDDNTGPQTTPHEQASSSEYPKEKVGWHEQQQDPAETPQGPHPSQLSMRSTPSPAPYGQESLDVSRLVTMPPPYPRHHPAVNNSHPELAATRTAVRTLSDLAEVDDVKEKFALDSSRRRDDFSKAAADRRQALRLNLQQEISSGNLGYSDAATIEADTVEEENGKTKDLEKSEYEHFQNQVVMVLNEKITEQIARATDLLDGLSRHLFDNSQIDADMPQEEGDDRPELLEKLTLLKWIFEARESLHRAIFDLLSERNTRFCEVVLTPYRLARNAGKIKSAEAFFAEDAAKREYAFRIEVLERSRDFRSVMEEAIERGITLQLSAFWDIAPPLCDLLDTIPASLEHCSIQIPNSEFEENPSYNDHPLQYLFSLLLHAEKSTYQFIESHTNLLCLLHEVKEAVVNAKANVLATQVEDADGTPVCEEERDQRARQMREAEDRRLTDDLKDKVRVVQDQWNSALGDSVKSVKERTGSWLLQTRGWDESLEDGNVVGV